MSTYKPPPDEPDGVTHTPQEVEDMETPRGKFDDWLDYRRWWVALVILLATAVLAWCAKSG